MQRSFRNPIRPIYRQLFPPTLAVVLGTVVGCGGCGPTTPPTATTGPRQPLAGVTLTVACADPAFARRLSDRAAGWAGKTGAIVRVEAKAPADAPGADVVVIRPAEIGAFAVRGELAPVPSEVRVAEHALQWGRIAVVYRSNLVGWAGEPLAVPLAGDGYALVYRADKFADEGRRKAFAAALSGRVLEPPATWEDLTDVAKFFAANGTPSLPPLPADPQRLAAHFQQIAACYDRPAQSDVDLKKFGADAADPGTSFHVQTGTWQPRLTAPGFAAAAGWLAQTRPYRMPGTSDDPVAALDGPAVMAVLSLAEIARLPKEGGVVAKRFKVAPLPGTRSYFDAAGKRHDAARQGNYVPFVGSGAWVAGVRKTSPHAAAAADLLADLAGPAGSLAAVGTAAAGVGPFRVEHVAPERRDVWLGYGFDADGTQALFAAVRQYLGSNVTNPAIVLRTPDQAAVMAILDAEVRKAANGESSPEAAMGRADAAWKALDAKRPADELIKWRRNAVGLP